MLKHPETVDEKLEALKSIVESLSTHGELSVQLPVRRTGGRIPQTTFFGGSFIEIAGDNSTVSNHEIYVRISDSENLYFAQTQTGLLEDCWMRRRLEVIPIHCLDEHMIPVVYAAAGAFVIGHPKTWGCTPEKESKES